MSEKTSLLAEISISESSSALTKRSGTGFKVKQASDTPSVGISSAYRSRFLLMPAVVSSICGVIGKSDRDREVDWDPTPERLGRLDASLTSDPDLAVEASKCDKWRLGCWEGVKVVRVVGELAGRDKLETSLGCLISDESPFCLGDDP
jgi:hypothetical protein